MQKALLNVNKWLLLAYAVVAGVWTLLVNWLEAHVSDPSARWSWALCNVAFSALNLLFLIFVLFRFKGVNQAPVPPELQESERRYRELVELANCIILRWARDGRITFLNEYGQHFLGYTAGEIVGRHVMDTIVPPMETGGRDLESLMEQICANPASFEQNINENLRRNGEKVWIAWTNRIILDEQGGLKEILSIGSDITERRRTEMALEASELKFRKFSENSATGVYIEQEGRLLYANPALAEIFGYDREKLLIINPLDLFDSNDRERVAKIMAGRSAGHLERVRGEYRAFRKDGRRIWVEIVGAGFLLNNCFADIGNVLDITQRKVSEERIQYLNRIYAVLSSINQVIVHEKSLQNMFETACRIAVERGKFRMAWIGLADDNREQLKPVACEGIVENFLEIVKWDLRDPSFLAGPAGTCYQTGESVACNDIEHDPRCERWRDQALQHGYRSFGSFPLKVESAVIGNINLYSAEVDSFDSEEISLLDELATGIGFAIEANRREAKRQEAEQEIHRLHQDLQRYAAELEERVRQRTAQLEASNKELEAFSFSVSHDLRAPLRAIDGWGQILNNDYSAQLDPDGRHCLDRIRSETTRMGQLIEDLLQLARVSRVEMSPVEVNLTSIVQTIAGRLQETHKERRMEISIEPDVMARGDPKLLEVALNNLLENASKYTGKRSLARIEFGTTYDQSFPEVPVYYVRDNGTGFDMARAQKLFSAFQRLHSASEFPGTGVGLATVDRIIRRHGGHIWTQAQVDRGATFFFTLAETKQPSIHTRS